MLVFYVAVSYLLQLHIQFLNFLICTMTHICMHNTQRRFQEHLAYEPLSI